MDTSNKAMQTVPVEAMGPTVVNLTPEQVLSVEQVDDDLLLHVEGDEAVRVAGFFQDGQPAEAGLWLVDEQEALVELALTPAPGGGVEAAFLSSGDTVAMGDGGIGGDVQGQGLAPASDSTAGAGGASAAGASSAGAGGGFLGLSPALGLAVVGGVGAVGIAAAEDSGSSSGGDGMAPDAVRAGFTDLQQAVDGVADFIDGDLGALTTDIGELQGERFTPAMVDPQVRAETQAAVEALDADASDAEQVAAAEAVTELVVANRVAIAEDFAQILPDLDIDAAAASIAADVEAGLEAPAGLDAGGEAVFDTIVAVQTNGAIVEALLENANATYELGLDVPGYMAPAVPDTADLESLLATASDSVAAVGALAVPATAAIQEIVDGQLAEPAQSASFDLTDTNDSVNADLGDMTEATLIDVALNATGQAPMIPGATDRNADGAVSLNLDARSAELDTLNIGAQGEASRFNLALENNASVIDTTTIRGDGDLFLNLANGDGYRLDNLDATAASGEILLVNGGPAVEGQELDFGDGDVTYVTASTNLSGSDALHMGDGRNAVETHFREGGIAADYQANVEAVNAGKGIQTFILDAWLDDAGSPLTVDVSAFEDTREFVFNDTHAGGMANVQDTLSNDIQVSGVTDDSRFQVRALTDADVIQKYAGAEGATTLDLTLAGADGDAAVDVRSDLAVNAIEVADTTGSFSAAFTLEEGAMLELGGAVTGGSNVANVAVGGGKGTTLDASELATGSMIDVVTDAAGSAVSVHGTANGLALENSGRLIGSEQSDLMVGSSGADTMTGGGGADVFQVSTAASGQNGTSLVADDADVVTDFSTADGDLLAFTGLDASQGGDAIAGSSETYLASGEADSFSDAMQTASMELEENGIAFVASEVEGSTFIFAREDNSDGTPEQVVELRGVGLDELDADGSFIAGELALEDEAVMLLDQDDTLVMEEESADGMAQMPAEAEPMLASAAEMGEMPVMEDAQPVM
ncbi:MAG: hypothetical protein ACQEXI_14820 [Pseudomonadota bacterium]